MRRDTETTSEDLRRPEGNSLLENYDLHDTGEREFVERAEDIGLRVEPWGIDMRHEDGTEGLIYDDAMDFKVYSGEELVAQVDVKTKSNPRYMGRFNMRHWEDYYEHAEKKGIPTFVVMFQVDKKTDTIQDELVYHVGDSSTVVTSRDDNIKTFPDGNHCAMIKHNHRKDWRHFEADVMGVEG